MRLTGLRVSAVATCTTGRENCHCLQCTHQEAWERIVDFMASAGMIYRAAWKYYAEKAGTTGKDEIRLLNKILFDKESVV